LLEIVQLLLLAKILTPDTETTPLKKSKMLLLVMRFPAFGLPEVPRLAIALVGKLTPAGPMLQNETVLLLFPTPVVVPKTTFPAADPDAGIAEPRIVHRVIELFWAPLIKRIVLVPVGPEAVVFESVSALPPLFSPSIVTLVAPFRSTNGEPAFIAPEMVCEAPPEGCIRTEVYEAVPPVAVRIAEPVSVVSPTMATLIAP
jgi:hypothetical protein